MPLVNRRLALLAEARVLPAFSANPHPGRLLALGAHQRHRRKRDRPWALDDSALLVGSLAALLDMPFDQPKTLDFQAISVPVVGDDLPALAGLGLGALNPRDDLHRVSNPEFLHGHILEHAAQRTSGAKEMIFMNFRARSSRATGPKIRVPTGSKSLVISTAELPSNLMKLPSARPTSRLVRTITALATSPFFTFEFGSASRIDTTITSPIDAYLRFEPPSTLIQKTFFAPELSATSSTLVI